MTTTIRVFSKEIKVTNEKDEQNVFCDVTYVNPQGVWHKVKFTKNCETTVKKPGYYLITFDCTNVSKEKSKTTTNKKGLECKTAPVLWFDKIEKIEHDEAYEKEMEEKKKKDVEDTFSSCDKQELPF